MNILFSIIVHCSFNHVLYRRSRKNKCWYRKCWYPMLIQRYHCNCYGYKEKGDCKSLTTKQMCDYRLKRKLWNIKQIENLRTIQQYNNNNKRKAKWDTTYFASKRYCLYNRTAKTTVQLQHLEANVQAKRKSNKEPI